MPHLRTPLWKEIEPYINYYNSSSFFLETISYTVQFKPIYLVNIARLRSRAKRYTLANTITQGDQTEMLDPG
jgi:hypothetical protein